MNTQEKHVGTYIQYTYINLLNMCNDYVDRNIFLSFNLSKSKYRQIIFKGLITIILFK